MALLKYFNDGFEVNDNLLRRSLLYRLLGIGKYRQGGINVIQRPRGTHRPRAI